MAIKKNVYSYDIKYDSKADAEVMKTINSKSNNNSSKSNASSSNDVENYSFDMEHKVLNGETLTEIASKYGLTYQELADYNNIADPNYIEVGQVINIPASKEEPDQSKDVEYQVIEGDNLTKIAEKYGLTYQELADYNNIADPNYIEVGQVINIPPIENSDPSSNEAHTVSSGETLSEIAARYGLTYQELADYNNIADPNYIEIGQKISIPPSKSTTKSQNQNIADDIKNLSKQFLKNIDSVAANLANKLKETNNLNNANEVANQVMAEIQKIGITIDEKMIKKLIDNNKTASENNNPVASNITNQIKSICQQEINALNSVVPLLTEKIKQIQEQNQNTALDLKQILTDTLKNIDYSNLNKYLDIFHYVFLKNSSNPNHIIKSNIYRREEDVHVPIYPDVTVNGDYLYISSPDSQFKFKIPLVKFVIEEVEENGKMVKKTRVEHIYDEDQYLIIKSREFLNDFINYSKNYDYEFLKTLKESSLDDEIQILLIEGSSYAGATTNGNKITINAADILSDDVDKRHKAQKILLHELGHAYDAAKGVISDTKEWKDIYSQIHKDSNSELMSISMEGEADEWFARCVDNYYFYPERLTQIKINYGNYNNLYDYMKDLITGKGA